MLIGIVQQMGFTRPALFQYMGEDTFHLSYDQGVRFGCLGEEVKRAWKSSLEEFHENRRYRGAVGRH